jgi:hypothetical protein
MSQVIGDSGDGNPAVITLQYMPLLVAGAVDTAYTYNLDRQLKLLTRPDNKIVSFAYDDAGRGTALDFGYDAANLLTQAGSLTLMNTPNTGESNSGFGPCLDSNDSTTWRSPLVESSWRRRSKGAAQDRQVRESEIEHVGTGESGACRLTISSILNATQLRSLT